jgi:hypothetical protein
MNPTFQPSEEQLVCLDGVCQRCELRPADEDVCRPCHRYLSALSDFDPAGCDCDPEKAWTWVLLVEDDKQLNDAALAHWREVTNAYAE